MSLHIYERVEDIPEDVKYIKVNDLFFNLKTVLLDTAFTRRVLSEIDEAEYVDQWGFRGRTEHLGKLDKYMLSTGAKTVLNVQQFPEYCFNLAECGNNAKRLIVKLKQGNVLWQNPILIIASDTECDIEFRGRHFDDVLDMLDITMEG